MNTFYITIATILLMLLISIARDIRREIDK